VAAWGDPGTTGPDGPAHHLWGGLLPEPQMPSGLFFAASIFEARSIMTDPASSATSHAALGDRWSAFIARHHGLNRLARWGMSVLSLVGGVVTLVLFRRGPEYFPWLLGSLLLCWLAAVAFVQLRPRLEGRPWLRLAIDWSVQGLYQDVLIVLLPFYYASTTFLSGNGIFFLLLVAAAILTTFDPWYQAIILRWPLAGHLLFAFSFFASLNVALPLVGLRSGWGSPLAGGLAFMTLTPAIYRILPAGRGLRGMLPPILAVAGGLFAFWGISEIRAWIPPTPLHLARGTLARNVSALEPVEPRSAISVEELRAWNGVVCFTAIYAPPGLQEPISHIWRKDGVVVATARLSPIHGGRAQGYRTYSRRPDLGPNPVGQWSVEILTAHGQLIGRTRFAVTG